MELTGAAVPTVPQTGMAWCSEDDRVKFSQPLEKGFFLRRLNRFLAEVSLRNHSKLAHVPNSGRLAELLTPGRRVLLEKRANPIRKTHYTLSIVKLSRGWASIDAMLPTRILLPLLQLKHLPEFSEYTKVLPEAHYLGSRFDFALCRDDVTCYLEVKSVTLVRRGLALFPDAPTRRGTKHLEHLIQAVERGNRAAVAFVIQRDDSEAFAPNDEADPHFGFTLRRAREKGVEIIAYRCHVSPREIRLSRRVPVHMN